MSVYVHKIVLTSENTMQQHIIIIICCNQKDDIQHEIPERMSS